MASAAVNSNRGKLSGASDMKVVCGGKCRLLIFYFGVEIFIAKKFQDDMSTRKSPCWRKDECVCVCVCVILKGFSVLPALPSIPAYTSCVVITVP